jgi:sulfatase maturation enzyme AslB (radical SAM superfamily)
MSKNVADKIISLIMKRKELEKVHFSWFGGEPLFNNEIISYICSELKKNNINYSSSMITNGLLFNKELILKAKDLWRLSHLQITLDGTEYEYEKIK